MARAGENLIVITAVCCFYNTASASCKIDSLSDQDAEKQELFHLAAIMLFFCTNCELLKINGMVKDASQVSRILV